MDPIVGDYVYFNDEIGQEDEGTVIAVHEFDTVSIRVANGVIVGAHKPDCWVGGS